MRERYAEAEPACRFNKKHWTGIRTTGDLPHACIREQIRRSCLLVLEGVAPRARREEIRACIEKSGLLFGQSRFVSAGFSPCASGQAAPYSRSRFVRRADGVLGAVLRWYASFRISFRRFVSCETCMDAFSERRFPAPVFQVLASSMYSRGRPVSLCFRVHIFSLHGFTRCGFRSLPSQGRFP